MQTSRRRLLKMLPLAALSGTAVQIGNRKAEAIEIRPERKFVFRVRDADTFTRDDLRDFKDHLIKHGYSKETVVIAGNVDIFEIQE